MAGEDRTELVAEYGALRQEPPSRERTLRLGELIVRLLQEAGLESAVRDKEPPVVAFRHQGLAYVMGVAWDNETAGGVDDGVFARSFRKFSAGASVILLSMSGFARRTPGQMTSIDFGRTLLWDRTHLEALVCGLATLPDLLEKSKNAAFFADAPYQTLARLLAPQNGAAPAQMAMPDRLPPPWPVFAEGYDGIPAYLILGSDGGWSRPSGIAVLDNRRLVVVTEDGLVEVDAARGTTAWLMQLPGCENEPLVQPDGSVLAACGSAIVRVTGDRLEAVAGGFDGNVHLLVGPDGDPWALSGFGASFGPEDGSLALTRIGTRVGEHHRYDIYFPAKVNAAAWLGGLRFFLAATGHSAVVDLARSTRAGRDSWIESPQGYEQQLVVTSPDSVVTAAGESTGIGVTLFRTNVSSATSTRLARFQLNRVDGLCLAPDGTGFLLGDMHAGRPYSLEPWPVLLRLPGLRSTVTHVGSSAVPAARPAESAAVIADEPAADAYDPVRLAAWGLRADYALSPAPIGRGGQADVFPARHKQSGADVAFKRLHGRDPDALSRMKREIEAAQIFGSNPHVMPVLDYSSLHDWFVMPRADDSAETKRHELAQTPQLRELVIAICRALRPAHQAGWVHRDLKPANLLLLDGQWTVADWGLTRRPHGQTSAPGRTQTGVAFGTDGWAAPELSVDAHNAGPQADIYAIGQIIGWVLTGKLPQANIPLLPPDGPWIQIVQAATQLDPSRRPPTVDALLEVIAEDLPSSGPVHEEE